VNSSGFGSGLLQDLGFLAFTLPHVEILMPTKQPRGEELTLEQQRTRRCTTAGCGSSMSIAVSRAVASSKTASVCGSRVSAIW
jgi:hypothetical protein